MGAPQWHTPAGTIRGWCDGDVVRATGIRYATTRRFAAPEPAPAFDAPFDATEPSPVCPQRVDPLFESTYRHRGRPVRFDEDCTRLSLTLPGDLAEGERLPVMVWIHGGSYTSGGADLDIYDPRHLVAEQRVIVVAVTYRLGLLGYLGRGAASPANLGLLDQLAALHWVAANVAAFGGDPGNVTLFGESAGADAVAHLMVAEGAEGLFQRAILQSAPLGVLPDRDPLVSAMTEALGELAADADVDSVLARQEVAAAAAGSFGLRSGMPFGIQYGASPVPPEATLDEAFARAARRVDVLVGHTTREGALFVTELPQLARAVNLPVVGRGAKEAFTRAITELVYARPLARFARRHHGAGGHGYRYLLDWGAHGNFYRAAHTAELPLLLGEPDSWADAWVARGTTREMIARDGVPVRALWGQFARTGRLQPVEIPGIIAVHPLV